MPAFLFQGGFHRRIGTERVGTASFAEAPKQNCVGRFEENNFRRNHLADGLQDSGKLFELRSFSDVHDQGRAANIPRLQRQFREARDQLNG